MPASLRATNHIADKYPEYREQGPAELVHTPPPSTEDHTGDVIKKLSEDLGIATPEILETEFRQIEKDVNLEWGARTIKQQEEQLAQAESDAVAAGIIPRGLEQYRLKYQRKYVANAILKKVLGPQIDGWINSLSHPDTGVTQEGFSQMLIQAFQAKFPESGQMYNAAVKQWPGIMETAIQAFLEKRRLKSIINTNEQLQGRYGDDLNRYWDAPLLPLTPLTPKEEEEWRMGRNKPHRMPPFPGSFPFAHNSPPEEDIDAKDQRSTSNTLLAYTQIHLSRDKDGRVIETNSSEGSTSHYVVYPTMIDGEVLTDEEAKDEARKNGWGEYPQLTTAEEAEQWIVENRTKIPPPLDPEVYDNPHTGLNKIAGEFEVWGRRFFQQNGHPGHALKAKKTLQNGTRRIKSAESQDDIDHLEAKLEELRGRTSGFGYLGPFHQDTYEELALKLREREEAIQNKAEKAPTFEEMTPKFRARAVEFFKNIHDKFPGDSLLKEKHIENFRKYLEDEHPEAEPAHISLFLYHGEQLPGFLGELNFGQQPDDETTKFVHTTMDALIWREQISTPDRIVDRLAEALKNEHGLSARQARSIAEMQRTSIDNRVTRAAAFREAASARVNQSSTEGKTQFGLMGHILESVLKVDPFDAGSGGNNAGDVSAKVGEYTQIFWDAYGTYQNTQEEEIIDSALSGEGLQTVPEMKNAIQNASRQWTDLFTQSRSQIIGPIDQEGNAHSYLEWDLEALKKLGINPYYMDKFEAANRNALQTAEDTAGIARQTPLTQRDPTEIEQRFDTTGGHPRSVADFMHSLASVGDELGHLVRELTAKSQPGSWWRGTARGTSQGYTEVGGELHTHADTLMDISNRETATLRKEKNDDTLYVIPYTFAKTKSQVNLTFRKDRLGNMTLVGELPSGLLGKTTGVQRERLETEAQARLPIMRQLSDELGKRIREGEDTWANGDPISRQELNPRQQLLVSRESLETDVGQVYSIAAKLPREEYDTEELGKEMKGKGNKTWDTYIAWRELRGMDMPFQDFLYDQLAGPVQIGHEEANKLLEILQGKIIAPPKPTSNKKPENNPSTDLSKFLVR